MKNGLYQTYGRSGSGVLAVLIFVLVIVAILVIQFLIIKHICIPIFKGKGYYPYDARKYSNWIAVISVLLSIVLGLLWSWIITLIIMLLLYLTLQKVEEDYDLDNKDRKTDSYDYREDFGDSSSPADELRKWKRLLDDGIITEEDFYRKKEDLLRK